MGMVGGERNTGLPLEAPFTNVDKSVAEKVLGEISTNPESSFMGETFRLQDEDEQLNRFLFSRQHSLGNVSHSSDYTEGSIWMYKLLKAQAESRGGSLPKLSRDLVMTFFEDLIQCSSKERT